jgi:hypothetical protein
MTTAIPAMVTATGTKKDLNLNDATPRETKTRAAAPIRKETHAPRARVDARARTIRISAASVRFFAESDEA